MNDFNLFSIIIIFIFLLISVLANILLFFQLLKKESIRNRILLSFIALVLNTAIIICISSTMIGYRSGKDQIEKHLKSISDVMEDQIKLWVNNLENELKLINVIDNFKDNAKLLLTSKKKSDEISNNMKEVLFKFLMNIQWLNKIFILSKDGYVILSTNNREEGEFRGLQDYFIKGKVQSGTFVQVLSYSSLTEGINSIITVIPIVDANNNTIGVLCGEASLKKLNEIMESEKGLGYTGETLIVGKNMVLLTNSKFKGYKYGSTYIGSHSIIQPKGKSIYNDYRNVRVIGVYRWIKELEIGLIAKQDEIEAFKNIYINLIVNIILTVIALIFSVLLSLFFTKSLTKGIINLNSGVNIISSGDFKHKIKIESNDEIGNLSKTFNMMIDKLNDYFNKINKSETRLRLALEGAGDGVWDWNMLTNEIYYSKKWKEILGYEDNEIQNNYSEWEKLVHPDDLEKSLTLIKKHIKGESLFFQNEHRLLCKNGEYKWVLTKGKIIEWDDNRNPIRFIGTHSDISEQKNIEWKLKNSVDDRETLIRELYHRTKNNMQVIISLMNLQSANINDEKSKDIINDMQNRIYSMAIVHKKLYESQNLSSINLKDYIIELSNLLLKSFTTFSDKINLDLTLDDVMVSIDTAIPCGLVLNELITNSIKHAFPDDRKGIIKILLKKLENEYINIIVSDNGIGALPNFLDISKKRIGIRCIFSIIENQLDGNVKFDTSNGFLCNITIKDAEKEERV